MTKSYAFSDIRPGMAFLDPRKDVQELYFVLGVIHTLTTYKFWMCAISADIRYSTITYMCEGSTDDIAFTELWVPLHEKS